MNTKRKNIGGWVLSGIIGLMLLASAFDKIRSSEHALQMASSFGISAKPYAILGIIEALSVVLFLFSRTGILGLLLLTSYLGGAIATHLQHGQDILFPAVIEALVWMAAVIRFPELSIRILKRKENKEA
ncbi:DoxX family protein [Olivibacter ginsenosidimutans]